MDVKYYSKVIIDTLCRRTKEIFEKIDPSYNKDDLFAVREIPVNKLGLGLYKMEYRNNVFFNLHSAGSMFIILNWMFLTVILIQIVINAFSFIE